MLSKLTSKWQFWVALAAFCVVALVGIVVGASYALEEVPNAQAGTMPAQCAELLTEIGMNALSPCPMSKDDLLRLLAKQFPDAGPLWWVKFADAALSGCPDVCTRVSCSCEYDIHALRGAYSDYLGEVAAQAAAKVPNYTETSESGDDGQIAKQLVIIILSWVAIFTIFGQITLFKVPFMEEEKGKVTLNTLLFVAIASFPGFATLGIVVESAEKLMWQIFTLTFAVPFIGYLNILIGRGNRALEKSTKKSDLILKKAAKVGSTLLSYLSNVSGLIPGFGIPWVALWAVYLGMDPIRAGLVIMIGAFMTQGLTCMIGSFWLYYTAGVNLARILIHESDRDEDEKEKKKKGSEAISQILKL